MRHALEALTTQVLGKAIEKAELTAERVLEEVRRLAFVDVTGCFDDAANLKPFSQGRSSNGRPWPASSDGNDRVRAAFE